MNITIVDFAIIQSERSNKILRPKRSLVEKMCVVFDVLSRMFERPWHGVQRLLPPKEGAGWGRDRERLKTKKIWYSLAYFPGFRKISNWFCTRPYFGSEKWRFLFFLSFFVFPSLAIAVEWRTLVIPSARLLVRQQLVSSVVQLYSF